jgi:hypothetical protein
MFLKEQRTLLLLLLLACIPVYLTGLIAETERAIKLLDVKLQNTYCFLATNKLKQIINSDTQNATQKTQLYVMKTINQKLATENAIIAQADKGKTIVIINMEEYNSKIQTFLMTNDFNTFTKDPTDRYQKLIIKTMQECNMIIDKRQIKYLTQKKPSPPTLKAQLKSHKTDIPIRPIINSRTAPSYKLAKHLNMIINQYITLNNSYNVINSTNLAHDLTKLELHENHRMITCDIKDLYVNIPIDETIKFLKAKLLRNNNTQITHQIIALLKATLSQNYFAFQQKIYQPEQGIAMGSPISSLVAEIFLQHYEDIHIKHLLDTKHIALYTRYVDILIIYDITKTQPQNISKHINQIHNNIKLNPTPETHNTINFLDLEIKRNQTNLEIDIYRKPTTTDTTINFHSNHPIEHTMAAF